MVITNRACRKSYEHSPKYLDLKVLYLSRCLPIYHCPPPLQVQGRRCILTNMSDWMEREASYVLRGVMGSTREISNPRKT